ncbi:hypothetical protein Dsin_031830 [Dipteronia sinensis]|uniref:Association with the SNF1 complex (ASC) domain-containing protein n=1 Tax=Dipteronia sinensis TaxID=43782 RepID=A0AAD9ZNJ9_9ROSI|nr:hypothetical protein Dsin_031830 [Dipteronia sinensis]
MVMGNASGREDGEGVSGVTESENIIEDQQSMEFGIGGQVQAHVNYYAHGVYMDPTIHCPPPPPPLPHVPITFQPPPLMFTSQVAMSPLSRPGEVMQVRDHAMVHDTTDYEDDDEVPEKKTGVMITWSYGGKKVAVTGSWDDWETVDPLWSSDKEFTIVKMLPSGVYHYRFIVDQRLRYAPDLPWECDHLGNAYNILDIQEYVPDALGCLSDFESPPSPFSSYNNEPLDGFDFSKAPPDLPPQLQSTLLNDPPSPSTMVSHQSLPRPLNTMLDHLYVQNSNDHDLPVAISSTCRFRQKYVTVVLYKPSRR